MTRINVVHPSELHQKMLVAEYRELPRIFNLVRGAISRGETPTDSRNPTRYTLGTGHCRFFYSRLGWLKDRQDMLITEMVSRGYKPSFTDTANLLIDIPPEWQGEWHPDSTAIDLNRQRIKERGG